MVGGGLVGLARLVVAAPGEALLALPAGLGAALDVPLPDLGLAGASPRSRATANPPLRTSSTPQAAGARTESAKAAASGSPAYGVPKGSRAVNVDPSAAAPLSAPPTTARSVAPCRPVKLTTHRSRRAAGTRTSDTSDVEAQGAQLLAAVGGDLVGAPRRHPDPVDGHVVDEALERGVRSGP